MRLFLLFLLCSKLAASFDSEVEFRKSLPLWTSKQLAGQLLFVGMRNYKQIKSLEPGGVVLFAWNMPSVQKVQALTKNLTNLSSTFRLPMIISTDHEGGDVIRIRKGVSNFPDAAIVGASGNAMWAEQIGEAKGLELRALGINTNLAPVLDLGNAKSFLRNRVWGSHPDKVAKMTSAYIKGLEKSGILAVAKHFPGHGSTTTDSHYGLPVSYKQLTQLWNTDLKPFREAIKENVPALMTAHVELSMLERVPASFSKRLLSSLLRDKMQYTGVIITDDLEMGGAVNSSKKNLSEAALTALRAGSDMVMLVWNIKHQIKVRDDLAKAIDKGLLDRGEVYNKIVRIWNAKKRFMNAYPKSTIASALVAKDTKKLINKVVNSAVRWRIGDEERLLKPFEERKELKWSIWLPNQFAKLQWSKIREQDSTQVFPRTLNKQQVKCFARKIEKQLASNVPVLIVTPPRAALSPRVFDALLVILNKYNHKKNKAPLLWVHQGSDPIPLGQLSSKSAQFGIMTLSSASRRSFTAFTHYLKQKIAL